MLLRTSPTQPEVKNVLTTSGKLWLAHVTILDAVSERVKKCFSLEFILKQIDLILQFKHRINFFFNMCMI